MAEPATRVALLARPGAACDNLQAALRQLGADVVAVQDPGDGDPAAIDAAHPAAVLVALEPAVEDALDRYDAVLAEPGRLVIYDEVAVAARREGWDAARWARHLAAKLGGHADVLPPGAGRDEDGAPPGVYAGERTQRGPEFGSSRASEAVNGVASVRERVWTTTSDGMALEALDSGTADAAVDADPAAVEALAEAGEGVDFGGFTPEMMAIIAEGDAGREPAPEPEPAPTPAAEPEPLRFRADEMSLVDIDPVYGARDSGFGGGFEEGGVVVLAGIGGPDAVRQFLVGVPAGFVRPIVVRQRLDGGRHDRLVRQMQRATALPVELAEEGRALVAGHVYILPDGMTTALVDGTATFAATDAPVPVLAGLPASDSVVLVLSGSDPALVPEILDAARQGALVAGQSPEESFDGAAAAALAAAGGEAHLAAELARRVSTRWLSLKD
jgi:chemosensory pili system protein ChpB (putative protein-glutamate methylesterase)